MPKKIDANETEKIERFSGPENSIEFSRNQGYSGHQKRKAFFSAAEIKKMLKSGSVLIGTERAMKSLKSGKVQKGDIDEREVVLLSCAE